MLALSDWIAKAGRDHAALFAHEPPYSPVRQAHARLSAFWTVVWTQFADEPELHNLSHPRGRLQRALNFINIVEPLDEALIGGASYAQNRPMVYTRIAAVRDELEEK
jgi:hypothetical protein